MKQGATLTRGIILMLLLALIAYGIAAAFSALEKSTATVTAIAYEVGDGFQSTGFVVRDEQILKALKPEGMLSNNRDAVVGMDRLLGAVGKGDPGVASSVIPAKINKDGEKFADKPKLTSKDDFIDLCGYVEKKIAAIGRDIASGKMIASPYREGDENACTYCPYNSVCGFDRDIKGYEYRDIKGLSDDEALQRMREE